MKKNFKNLITIIYKNILVFIFLVFIIPSNSSFASDLKIKLIKEITLQGYSINSLVYSRDGLSMLLAGYATNFNRTTNKFNISLDGDIRTFEIKKNKYKVLGTGSLPSSVAYSADGLNMYGKIGSKLYSWDVKTRNQIMLSDKVEDVYYSTDYKQAFIKNLDGTLKLINLALGETIQTYPKSDIEGRIILLSSGQKGLLFLRDDQLFLRNLENGEDRLLGEWKWGGVSAFDISTDGSILACGSDSGTVVIWDLTSAKKLAQNNLSHSRVNAIDISPDLSSVAYAGVNGTLYLWSLTKEKVQIMFGQHILAVLTVSFSPDGNQITTTSFDETIKIWELTPDEEAALNSEGKREEISVDQTEESNATNQTL